MIGIAMNRLAAFVILFLFPFVSVSASEPKLYEIPRTQVIPILEAGSDRQYELYVKLPGNYEENTDKKYPVIYTTDAVWHFDMLSGATEYLMPDVILVGISWQKNLDDEREFVSRFRDYMVVKSETAAIPTGEASNHLSFIRNDVIKLVESRYRTDPKRRSYFGYSLGGQFGAYILFAAPDTFQNYVLGSPAFSERGANFIDALEAEMAGRQQMMNANVYVSIGELEESEMDVTENFVSVLQRRGETGLMLTGLEIIEDSDHSTAFPETVIRSVKWLSRLSNEQ